MIKIIWCTLAYAIKSLEVVFITIHRPISFSLSVAFNEQQILWIIISFWLEPLIRKKNNLISNHLLRKFFRVPSKYLKPLKCLSANLMRGITIHIPSFRKCPWLQNQICFKVLIGDQLLWQAQPCPDFQFHPVFFRKG